MTTLGTLILVGVLGSLGIIFGSITLWSWMAMREERNPGSMTIEPRVARLEEEVEELRRLVIDAIVDTGQDEPTFERLRENQDRRSGSLDAS